MTSNIYVALSSFSPFSDAPLELLKKSGSEFTVNPFGRRLLKNEVIEQLQGFDGVVAGLEPYDTDVLSALPQLKCISRCGVGIDNINLDLAKEKGITIKNTPDVVVLPVAELTIGMILDLLRRLTYHSSFMKKGEWHRQVGQQLSGKKVGVIGLGRIGKRVAELLINLGANVYGADLMPDLVWSESLGVKIISLPELLSECDVVTIHVSPSSDHKCILGENEISQMKKNAFLVNTARGQLVDENALYNALKSGYLAGAALDVYNDEPYNGPLCSLDNIVLSPHVATFTKESRVQMEFEAVKNVLDFFC